MFSIKAEIIVYRASCMQLLFFCRFKSEIRKKSYCQTFCVREYSKFKYIFYLRRKDSVRLIGHVQNHYQDETSKRVVNKVNVKWIL